MGLKALMPENVYVVKCPDYHQAADKLVELVSAMGGMHRFAQAGQRIVLKVNLLRAAVPEAAVTTHPAVVSAVARLAKAAGADVLIADSPGGGYRYSPRSLEKIYRTCGMDQAASEAGVSLNMDTRSAPVSFPQGLLTKRFDVISPVIQSDGVINLCKLKTHLFTGMTGAVKNSFGVVPGLLKPGFHAKLHDASRFAGMLLDLSAWVAPRLHVMDAVLAMEGDGPGSGDPRHVGLLLAAENPVALDMVAAEIIGLSLQDNPVLSEARRRGLAPTRLDDIELIGADLSKLRVPGFRLAGGVTNPQGLARLPWYKQVLEPLFKDAMTLRPCVSTSRCVACGACVQGCPVAAVAISGQAARIDDNRCIRCYCCHEMCPEKAVVLRRGWLFRLVRPV
jgi:uncharacterized protein (DUF362 family)/Pyruvate/2-oxoacid:ferredoxin oxidoreductase delta subunit